MPEAISAVLTHLRWNQNERKLVVHGGQTAFPAAG
jgi:hypothetical protein